MVRYLRNRDYLLRLVIVAHLDQYNNGLLKAVIVPHAGYSYSGATAAHSYARIDPSLYDRVFVLVGRISFFFCKWGTVGLIDIFLDRVLLIIIECPTVESLHLNN